MDDAHKSEAGRLKSPDARPGWCRRMPALALVLIVGLALARTGDVANDEFDVHLWQYNFTTKAMDETRFHVRNGEFFVEPSDAGSLTT